MDLRISNTGFQGKKEILYGLNKAANLAKDYETKKVVYINSRMQMNRNEEQIAYNSSMSAYLDMVIRDSEFIKTIDNITERELKPIKKTLIQETNEHGFIQPMNKFSQIINQVADNSYYGKSKETVKSYINKLLIKLKS